ncbi:MAG: hypothetical protein NT126_09185 [Bacteroidetes bacterium]|nr:hypothetical protein [Bacteroidota bacterium]
MILIADSGSTKTDWRLVDDEKKIHSFRSAGLNPYFLNIDEIAGIIEKDLLPFAKPEQIRSIYFYGAGCSPGDKRRIVSDGIKKNYPDANLEMNDDLVAACRALSGKQKAIVCILGTGSNSCLFDGNKMVDQVPSLGFILGDEGSGTDIGKKFLRAYFYRELNAESLKLFEHELKYTREEILHAVYKEPSPNRFIASFSEFVFKHRTLPEMTGIVHESFSGFFDRHVCKYHDYRNLEVHCTGSIGFHFENIFREVAGEKGIRAGKITRSPMEGLIAFHLGKDDGSNS